MFQSSNPATVMTRSSSAPRQLPGAAGLNTRNRILSLLSAEDLALLTPHLEPVELTRGQVLVEPFTRIDHAWFLEVGLGSMIAISPDGDKVESGLLGRDAVAPGPLVLGVRTMTCQLIVQVPGSGLRMRAEPFLAALEASATMRDVMQRYFQTLFSQCAFTALSNAIHQIDERCARWLLMTHDRSDGDEIELTHEFLSLMLAVRRPSVTTALHVLEGNRLIRAGRGWITIRDRDGLEEFAANAYGIPEREYADLLGPMRLASGRQGAAR